MTDRINAFTVVLEKDIRVDDVQPILDAIKQIRGVLSVESHVADLSDHLAYERARRDLRERLWKALEE